MCEIHRGSRGKDVWGKSDGLKRTVRSINLKSYHARDLARACADPRRDGACSSSWRSSSARRRPSNFDSRTCGSALAPVRSGRRLNVRSVADAGPSVTTSASLLVVVPEPLAFKIVSNSTPSPSASSASSHRISHRAQIQLDSSSQLLK